MKIFYRFIMLSLLLFCIFEGCEQRGKAPIMSENLKGTIVFSRLGDIYTYHIDSKQLINIFATHRTGHYAADPTWLDQRRILFTLQDAAFSKKYITSIDGKGEHSKIIFKSNENCIMPAASSDNRKIAFLCGAWQERLGRIDYKLCVSNLNGSGLKIFHLPLLPFKPSWSPNGEQIAITDISNTINVVSIKTGISEKISVGVAPSFSPDGLRIAFIKPRGNSNRSDLRLVILSSKEERTLLENDFFGGPPEWAPQWTADGKFILYVRFGSILLPSEKQMIEAYSIEYNKSISLLEVKNKIQGFSYYRY